MIQNPFQSRPYFDWGIDRWKIGIALLLLLILIFWSLFRAEQVDNLLVENGQSTVEVEPSALSQGGDDADGAQLDSADSASGGIGEETGDAADAVSVEAQEGAAGESTAGTIDATEEADTALASTTDGSNSPDESATDGDSSGIGSLGAGGLTLSGLRSGDTIPQGLFVWTGTATPQRRVQLVEQSAVGETKGVLGTVTADEEGAWRLILFNPLELGEHHVIVREITEDNQVSSQTEMVSFTVIEP